MDAALLAVAVACATIASEKEKKKKRPWVRPWKSRRKQRGPYILRRELEVGDSHGFIQILRMTAEEFDVLFEKVQPLITKKNTKMRLAIAAKDKLSLTLRFLATGESFKSLSIQHEIGASTVSNIVSETCEALHQVLKNDYLKTPQSEAEWLKVAEEFEQKWQLPNCLGALDGKYIPIQVSASAFDNHKCRSFTPMMAVVDANFKFLNVSVGSPNSASDVDLFTHSDFYNALEGGLLHIPPPKTLPNTNVVAPFMFVGGDAYPLRSDLIIPYSHGQLDHQQQVFNYRLTRAHRVVENAFGILANRWRVFRTNILLHPDKISQITLAAVCLHNFLRDCESEAYVPPGLADAEDAEHRLVEGDWRREGLGPLRPLRGPRGRYYDSQATQRREVLKEYFVSSRGLVPWQDANT